MSQVQEPNTSFQVEPSLLAPKDEGETTHSPELPLPGSQIDKNG